MKKITTIYIRIALAVLLLVLFAFGLKAQNIKEIKTISITPQQTNGLNTIAQKRLPSSQACMELTERTVKLVLWDCGVEDNDTVSISLNGQWVLHKFRLTNAKQEMEITLNLGENQLSLLANNLGDIPDNTAAIAIKENGIEQKATLSSNLQTNGTLKMLVKAKNLSTAVLSNCPEKQVFMDEENKQVRANPDLANPSFRFLHAGIRKNTFETDRKLEIQGCTNISDSVATLYFWDSGVEDNDTISVNLNGVWIVKDLRLRKEKQAIQVKLQPGSNYIIMYANNLGDIPNNTSGVGIDYKFGKQDLGTLYSDKFVCGTFRFNCSAGATIEMASQPCIKNETARNNRRQTDPEMQVLYGKTSTQTQQPTQYSPQQQPNYAPAIGTAVHIGVGVISTLPRGGNNNPPTNGGNSGTTPRQPTNTSPTPTRNPDKPINY